MTTIISNPLDQLPSGPAVHLRWAVRTLNNCNEQVYAHLIARGPETASMVAQELRESMAQARANLAQFAALARANGFDPQALIGAAAEEYGLGQFATLRPCPVRINWAALRPLEAAEALQAQGVAP
jgi:hypothetical protein